MATSLFNQRKLASRRATADITRLANQYKGQVNQITTDYETSFANWQKGYDEAMAPYNAKVDQYKKDYSAYETALAGYTKRLTDYTNLLEDINKNPLEAINAQKRRQMGRFGGTQVNIGGTWYGTADIPDGYTYENGQLYKKRDAGAFTEAAPKAPDSPGEAPKVAAFDETPFQQKRAETDMTYKREVAERRAAKLGAVSRTQSRPLLSGAKA